MKLRRITMANASMIDCEWRQAITGTASVPVDRTVPNAQRFYRPSGPRFRIEAADERQALRILAGLRRQYDPTVGPS